MARTFLAFSAAVTAVVVGLALPGGLARAAEIKVMSSVGYSAAVNELSRRFESQIKHKVVIEYEVVAVLRRRIDAGEAFDVAILSPEMIDQLIAAGKVASDSRATLGRIGMAFGVRRGGPKPDIKSQEALRRALLDAKSIAYSKEGGSGKTFAALLDRLGIAEEMKPRIKAVGAPTTQAAVRGEAELVFTSVTAILADPTVELVGRLPAELQTYVTPTLGVSTAAKDLAAANAFFRFLTSAAAAPALEAYGVEAIKP